MNIKSFNFSCFSLVSAHQNLILLAKSKNWVTRVIHITYLELATCLGTFVEILNYSPHAS